MIRLCRKDETNVISDIINDAAIAYRGVIPDDRYHEPYMAFSELVEEINDGVVFWGYANEKDELIGVMGLQDKGDVQLIRHAYVRTKARNGGIGGKLLEHLKEKNDKPILIGTWASAEWAIRFYEKNGFRMVADQQKEKLLRQYWSVPDRQIQLSVVLADSNFH